MPVKKKKAAKKKRAAKAKKKAAKKKRPGTPWPQAAKDAFLLSLTHHGTVALAIRRTIEYTGHKVSRGGAYYLYKNDEEFAKAWDEALENSSDLIYEEARRRAVEGVEEPVYHQGVMIDTVVKFSDSLMARMLQARVDGFQDRIDHTVMGDAARPLQIETGCPPACDRLGDDAPDEE